MPCGVLLYFQNQPSQPDNGKVGRIEPVEEPFGNLNARLCPQENQRCSKNGENLKAHVQRPHMHPQRIVRVGTPQGRQIEQHIQPRPQQVYSNYELGQRDIPTEVLILLSNFYEVSVDYLLGLTSNPKRSL